MLLRFLVGNYKSFNSVQEFSMIAGKTRTNSNHLIGNSSDLKLLRLGAIFGANASGKSNLISAIHFAQSVILNNTEDINNEVYYKLNDDSKNKPSYFEFEIKLEEKYYTYGFELNIHRKEFETEWLYEISPHKEKMIFNRTAKNGVDIGFKNLSNIQKQKVQVYIDDIKNNNKISFLNEMNRNKNEIYKGDSEINILNKVYKWFKYTLDINYPKEPITSYSYLSRYNKNEVLNIIKSFGTGISDFIIVDSSIDEIAKELPTKLIEKLKKDINDFILFKEEETKNKEVIDIVATIRGADSIYLISLDEDNSILVNTIVFEHELKNKEFKLAEESDGTKRLLDLIEILLPNEDEKEKVYIIDELDRSLHPQLTYKFIEIYSKYCENYKKQLIITTHESRLLDFELLRRDEIWFIEKKNGTSDLYSLEAFNERFDKKIDKAYLDGRYGGVPIFTSIYPVKEK